jgi:hypothetical protein
LVALQLFDDQAEAFDFAITMLKFVRHIAHQAMQLLCVGRQIGKVQLHD